MHIAYRPRCSDPRPWWATHLYIVAIALVASAPLLAQPPGRELLNSERIAAEFGSYGVDVLEQDEHVRVSNLFSGSAENKICRTFAVVRFGSPSGQEVHVLRKHGIVVVEDGRVRLSDWHLSPDGQRFFWRNKIIYLDRDEVWTVCYGPEGPPVSGQDA